MLKNLLALLLPEQIMDAASAAAGLAGFDPSPVASTSPPVDTEALPYACSAEAGLMLA